MKKILGMGNALVDILTRLDHDGYLNDFGLPKGSMTLVDAATSGLVFEGTRHLDRTVRSGGSAANTIHGLARMGLHTGFAGTIGHDNLGQVFRDDMTGSGIQPHLGYSPAETGRAMALISPDSERTFATFLGAATDLSPRNLSPDLFRQYDYFHIEGYLVQNHELLETALAMARESQLQISLDLASYNVVDQNREFLEAMLSRYVDIVFANEEEARSLTGLPPAEALEKLAALCPLAVVKTGREGSLVARGNERAQVGIIDVNSIDTTGAGDLYASGFLFGLIRGLDIRRAGAAGAILAGKVIETIGPKLDEETWTEVRKRVENEIL